MIWEKLGRLRGPQFIYFTEMWVNKAKWIIGVVFENDNGLSKCWMTASDNVNTSSCLEWAHGASEEWQHPQDALHVCTSEDEKAHRNALATRHAEMTEYRCQRSWCHFQFISIRLCFLAYLNSLRIIHFVTLAALKVEWVQTCAT